MVPRMFGKHTGNAAVCRSSARKHKTGKSCTLRLAPCTLQLVPCTLQLVPCTLHFDTCSLCLHCPLRRAPCTSCTLRQATFAPCTLRLAPCTCLCVICVIHVSASFARTKVALYKLLIARCSAQVLCASALCNLLCASYSVQVYGCPSLIIMPHHLETTSEHIRQKQILRFCTCSYRSPQSAREALFMELTELGISTNRPNGSRANTRQPAVSPSPRACNGLFCCS